MPMRSRQKSGAAELRRDVAQAVVAGGAAAELHLRLARRAGRARRGRPGCRPARSRRSARAPRPTGPRDSCTCRASAAAGRPAAFATWPWNLPSLANAAPSFARERVGEPEAGVVPRGRVLAARIAEAGDETNRWHGVRLEFGDGCHGQVGMCARDEPRRRSGARNKKARRDARGGPSCRRRRRRLTSSCRPCRIPSSRRPSPRLPACRSAAAGRRARGAGGCRGFRRRRGFDRFLDVRLRHDRRRRRPGRACRGSPRRRPAAASAPRRGASGRRRAPTGRPR